MELTNKNNSIVCLGHDENALLFNAIGIKGFAIYDSTTIDDKVTKLVEEGIKIILVSNKFSDEINKLRRKYEGAYPIFLLIPLDGKVDGNGVEQIRLNVERATGINLF